MATINQYSILAKVLRAHKTKKVAVNFIEKKVATAKEELLEEFDGHPVTIELLQGATQPFSAMLPGNYGNLYSFLGFDSNKENPVHAVRKLIEKIHLFKTPRVFRDVYNFTVKVPDEETFHKASPMEWESGRSWISAITHGIGTFSHYMFNLKAGRFQNSKSGTAIQVGPNLRSTASYFSGVGYVLGMMGRFKRRIGQS